MWYAMGDYFCYISNTISKFLCGRRVSVNSWCTFDWSKEINEIRWKSAIFNNLKKNSSHFHTCSLQFDKTHHLKQIITDIIHSVIPDSLIVCGKNLNSIQIYGEQQMEAISSCIEQVWKLKGSSFIWWRLYISSLSPLLT